MTLIQLEKLGRIKGPLASSCCKLFFTQKFALCLFLCLRNNLSTCDLAFSKISILYNVGTPMYMAPEFFAGENPSYDKSVDVFGNVVSYYDTT